MMGSFDVSDLDLSALCVGEQPIQRKWGSTATRKAYTSLSSMAQDGEVNPSQQAQQQQLQASSSSSQLNMQPCSSQSRQHFGGYYMQGPDQQDMDMECDNFW
jgi:hypothetical protein